MRDTNGHLQFLQLVGLTDEEMEAVAGRRVVLQALLAMPLWISDLHRDNLLEDPALAQWVQAGSEREGSSTGMLFIETLDWREAGVTTLVLGAGQVASVNVARRACATANRWNWPAASGSGSSSRMGAVKRRTYPPTARAGHWTRRACRPRQGAPSAGFIRWRGAAHRSGADLPRALPGK